MNTNDPKAKNPARICFLGYDPDIGSADSAALLAMHVDLKSKAPPAKERRRTRARAATPPAGPEELPRLLALAVGSCVRLLHTPSPLGFALTRLVGLLLRDVVLTRDEVDGLMAELLTSNTEPTGTTKLSDWLEDNGECLGREHVSELRRNLLQVLQAQEPSWSLSRQKEPTGE